MIFLFCHNEAVPHIDNSKYRQIKVKLNTVLNMKNITIYHAVCANMVSSVTISTGLFAAGPQKKCVSGYRNSTLQKIRSKEMREREKCGDYFASPIFFASVS